MKILVYLAVCVSICTEATTMDSKSKQSISSPKMNSIPIIPQKPMMYLQHAQVIPVQILSRPVYPFTSQPTHAVMIIAQPALLPQHLIYSNQPQSQPNMAQQQLLNYFHSNPNAKYQFLYGFQQPVLPVHPSGSSTGPSYQEVASNPISPAQTDQAMNLHSLSQLTQLNPVSSPSTAPSSSSSAYFTQPITAQDASSSHTSSSQQYPSPHSQLYQLSQLASYANLGAQHYSHASPQYTQAGQQQQQQQQYTTSAAPQYQLPIRTAPPIITGFENFTPEQQAQIKAQLGAHLSGQVTTPLSSSSVQGQENQSQEYSSQEDKGGVQGEDSKFTPVYKPQYSSHYTKG